jgi:RecA-family ATPase
MTLTDRARRYLSTCPPAISGAGGHSQTYSVAVALTHGFQLQRDAALSLLREYNAGCQPPWSERELAHKIDESIRKPHDKPAGFLLQNDPHRRPSCVSPSGKFIVRRDAPQPAASDMPAGYEATRKFLTSLFQPTDWVSIACEANYDEDRDKYTPGNSGTFMPVKRWLEEHFAGNRSDIFDGKPQGAWIRINPTLPERYDGSDSNVSAWRHVLVEFDDKPKDEQLAIIRQCNLPVAAIIDSGGRSLHAWVRVDASDKREWELRRDMVYDYLSDQHPCESNKNPSRFSRLPGVMRDGNEQRLVALNVGLATWQEWLDWRDQSELSEPTTPQDLLDYNVDHDTNNILGQRWLCRGGSLVIVGQSGVGKSSFAMQFGLTLALGKRFFGITPVRPLRVAFIQAENDRGDMAEAFRGVVRGMSFNASEMDTLNQHVRFFDETVKTGSDFVRLARSVIVKHRADLLIADPLLSYAGDDISDQAFMSRWLRNELNPVLQETGVVWVWLHHMPKPPKGEQAKGTVSDLAYAGAGSADLTNWAREVAVLQRQGDEPVFTWTLTKRGSRAGMLDLDGNPTAKIRLQHSSAGICWEHARPAMFKPTRKTAAPSLLV